MQYRAAVQFRPRNAASLVVGDVARESQAPRARITVFDGRLQIWQLDGGGYAVAPAGCSKQALGHLRRRRGRTERRDQIVEIETVGDAVVEHGRNAPAQTTLH